MAAPNIAGLTTVTGSTIAATFTTSSADILTNAAASGKVYKINTIIVANTNATQTCNILYFQASNSTSYYIAKVVSVPAASSLVIVNKSNPIYLLEGDKIQGLASAGTSIDCIISYEIIS